MKKYRLKEEVKEYVPQFLHNLELTHEHWIAKWNAENVRNLKALEEVPQRVELRIHPIETDNCHTWLQKTKGNFTDQEKDLCEKALNGETYDFNTVASFIGYLEDESIINVDHDSGGLCWRDDFNKYLKSFKD
jgi:hypothetical protein